MKMASSWSHVTVSVYASREGAAYRRAGARASRSTRAASASPSTTSGRRTPTSAGPTARRTASCPCCGFTTTRRGTSTREVRSQRPAVLRRLHAIDAARLHERRRWVVSSSILSEFGRDSREMRRAGASTRPAFRELETMKLIPNIKRTSPATSSFPKCLGLSYRRRFVAFCERSRDRPRIG